MRKEKRMQTRRVCEKEDRTRKGNRERRKRRKTENRKVTADGIHDTILCIRKRPAVRIMTRKVLCWIVAAVLLVFMIPVVGADDWSNSILDFYHGALKHSRLLENTFSISGRKDVIEELQKESSVYDGRIKLADVLTQAGMTGSFTYTVYDDKIKLSDIEYYAGWTILNRWERGEEDRLSKREKETLNEALRICDGAEGTDLEKERYIYDALCERITYETGEKSGEEKDCAIGALLNGRADCDGYADAMMLCCGLSGIPCRYIHGEARQRAADDDISHLWNAVWAGDCWLMCDVTWGDHGGEPEYLFFNIGTEDASASYRWDPDTLFTPVAENAIFEKHLMADQQPRTVTKAEDAAAATADAAAAGERRFTLFCPKEILWETDADRFWEMLGQGGIESCSYIACGRLIEFSGVVYR